MPTMSRRRHCSFIGLIFAAMGASTIAVAALGILATFIIDDLAISRGTLGWIVSTNVLIAAALSPIAGVLTDRIGGRYALVIVFAASLASFTTFGLAGSVVAMVMGSALAALSQAGGNPATNRLIGDLLPAGERGVATGIKQSGVQAGIAIAGITLPTMAIAFGWRAAMIAVACGPLIGVAATLLVVPRDTPVGERSDRKHHRLARSVFWLALFGAVFGFAGSVMFFIPLFSEESLGLGPRVGGIAVALAGVVAFAARIGWARFAERNGTYRVPLGVMAAIGTVAAATLLMATVFPALLWPGVALIGMSTSAWNSVGMLAVIDESGGSTGRASGVVLLGFLAGLGVGPPLYGAMIDASGSYVAMWIVSASAAIVALSIIALWGRDARRDTEPSR
jgi:predicted MFS family arabinose efflux permease